MYNVFLTIVNSDSSRASINQKRWSLFGFWIVTVLSFLPIVVSWKARLRHWDSRRWVRTGSVRLHADANAFLESWESVSEQRNGVRNQPSGSLFDSLIWLRMWGNAMEYRCDDVKKIAELFGATFWYQCVAGDSGISNILAIVLWKALIHSGSAKHFQLYSQLWTPISNRLFGRNLVKVEFAEFSSSSNWWVCVPPIT